jgi:hypothetical protein
MLCYGFPWHQVPACSAKGSSWLEPLLHLVDQITFWVFPHTSEQDSQPTTSLISKQVIPYRTCGVTCCPRVTTPKTWSLAVRAWQTTSPDRFQPSPPFQPMLKPQHRSSPQSPHITMDGRPKLSTVTQAKLNIIKMERLVPHTWLHG